MCYCLHVIHLHAFVFTHFHLRLPHDEGIHFSGANGRRYQPYKVINCADDLTAAPLYNCIDVVSGWDVIR